MYVTYYGVLIKKKYFDFLPIFSFVSTEMEVHVLTAGKGRCDSAVLKTTRFKISTKTSSINSPHST